MEHIRQAHCFTAIFVRVGFKVKISHVTETQQIISAIAICLARFRHSNKTAVIIPAFQLGNPGIVLRNFGMLVPGSDHQDTRKGDTSEKGKIFGIHVRSIYKIRSCIGRDRMKCLLLDVEAFVSNKVILPDITASVYAPSLSNFR